jgi:hypothetical protein
MADDTSRGIWERAARPPRAATPICALADGRVMHFNDRDYRTGLTDAWLYDPSDDTFAEAARPPWRSSYAVLSAEGWIVMAGGVDNAPSARCALYIPLENLWLETPPLPEPRQNHQLLAAGGRLYAIAGDTGDHVARDNFWSWAPGEPWTKLPDLPRAAKRTHLAARALDDGSLVVWSKLAPCDLYRWDQTRWTPLGALDEGTEILDTAEGLLAIGGVRKESHPEVRAWSRNRWTGSRALPAARCYADAIRLADGRAVVLAGQRHDHYYEDNSSGGELDLEYRSFSRDRKYGLVDCEDLELETTTGWVTIMTPIPTKHCVIAPLRDGRVLLMKQYELRSGYYPESYIWRPPACP